MPPEELPRHVAIIMDGNRRWARARGLTEMEGHAAGVEAIREIIRHAVRRGIEVLSLYAFSRENWARSDEEVERPLLRSSRRSIRNETAELVRTGRRAFGCSGGWRAAARDARLDPGGARGHRGRAAAASSTSPSTTRAGPSWWTRPARSWPRACGRRRSTRTSWPRALYTAGLPDPDLVIRTGGEQRLSNFLIWQSAYAEFVFSSDALAGLRAGRAATRPSSSSPAGSAGSGGRGTRMRQRALSALVFVPPLLIVLALGEPWFGALIAAFVAVAAWETGRLLRGAGYAAVPWLIVAGALAVAADVAAPSWLAGVRRSAHRGGGRGRGDRRLRGEGHEGRLRGLDGDRLRRGVRRAAGRAGSAGPGRAGRRRRPRRPLSSARTGAGSCS